jgi:Abnormal spindle-like microcephaly-assoc'd, ASPM-SPD-2-Hydin/Immunoglobulin domain/Cep192 domain 4/Immunoglobulin I-set domain
MTFETHNRSQHVRPAAGRISVLARSLVHYLIPALLVIVVLVQSGCVGLTGADSSELVFSPSKVDFGQVTAGSKKTVAVTLTNTRTTSLTLPQATMVGQNYSFSGPELPMTLDSGGIVTFDVSFAPTTTGAAPGTLIVSSEDSNLPPESLALTGMGLSASGPTITAQPASQTVTVGQNATFVVSASGTDPLSYQWKKNGSDISGATAATYITPPVSSSDSGAQFTVTVTDSVGTVTSDAATLTVTTSALPPSITNQPADRSVTAGQTAAFSVTATGTTPLSYQWQKNGVNISGATATSYTTPATATSDNGAQFSVIVTNVVGSVNSRTATLTVNIPLTIISQPVSQTVVAGQTATFSITATGASSITYQWRKNGANIIGANAPTYTTPATTAADSGAQFSVTLTSSAGTVTSNNATLTVTATPVAPSITTQPANRTVITGQTATFSVTATGTTPMSYQWRKNGASISGATAASYTTPATTPTDNGAQFSVVVSNSVGNVTSSAATLTVNDPPSITSQPTNQTVVAGQTATFSASASGSAPLNYQWRKNNANISGATGASYTTPATATADNGAQFSVVVNNSVGSVTSNSATLTVTAAPVAPSITTQPADRTVASGQTATFSVSASGTAPLTYQWKKNNTNISGATAASYTTPVTTTADNGAQFTVVVGNTVGSITSNAATLTVNAATFVLSSDVTSLNFGSVNVGSNKGLSARISNSGNSNVSISSVSLSGPGFSASGISSGLTLTPGQTATLNVTFAPTSTGSAAGTVSVTSNATNSPVNVSLAGSGVQPVQHSSTLSWSPSTSSVAGYYAYRGTVSGGPYTKLNSSATTSTSFTDSTVQAGQTYFYVVTAVDSSGVESVSSNQVSGTIPTP